nr:Xaa-Pro peptidase family protein [uncultured Gellertiella sp.]
MADYTKRLAALRGRMQETGTDLLAVGPSSHMMWLSGVSPHGDERPVMQIVTADHVAFLMPKLNADAARKDTDIPFYPWADDEGAAGALDRLLGDFGAKGKPGLTVALDESMRADFALLLLGALDQPHHRFTAETLAVLRGRKDEDEYRRLKENALINDRAAEAAFASLKEGMREIDVAEVVKAFYRAEGAVAEFTIVGFGENGAFPHHYSSERRLKRGDSVLLDIGGRSKGYPSDMTRMGYFGEAPEGLAEIHAVVDRAVRAAVAAARPGVRASAVDAAARGVITEAGYGDLFLHRTGHGLGIDIHEGPYITATSDVLLEEGNVFSIEPGIYLKDRFGVRLEEIVILRAEGAEILSELPRTLIAGS